MPVAFAAWGPLFAALACLGKAVQLDIQTDLDCIDVPQQSHAA